jgi:hypothetical protein
MKRKHGKKIILVTVDMGYGHQRTAYPLKGISYSNKAINANNYEYMPQADKSFWKATRIFYEFISNFKRIPLAGDAVFKVFDKFQQIQAFYPKRDLSRPTHSLRDIFRFIESGWGKDLIEKIKSVSEGAGGNLAMVSTFFIPAFMAEYYNYPGDIFCIICDADISRTWVPLNPKKSRIKYFASNSWTKSRLKLYGVKDKNIFLTGYPLPMENIGDKSRKILKQDLKRRIINLDPKKEYRRLYSNLIKDKLGNLPKSVSRPLTILFSIGGAGAQKEIVREFIKSLAENIRRNEVKIILSCGIKIKVKKYFEKVVGSIGLDKNMSKNIELIFERDIDSYFSKFNQKLREADILWTKPSELSFYSGLGMPIIIAPSLGSQEDFNKKWLLKTGSGVLQENPKYANQWMFDYLNSGRFAEAAMEGFIEIEKMGVCNIKKICLG